MIKSHITAYATNYHTMESEGRPYHGYKIFLINRHQRVVLDGFTSELHPVNFGVPQGTILAPLLFLCHINDLPSSIQSKIGLYADDTILYSTIHSSSDCITLQKDLDSLMQWATKWKMCFNPEKSEHMKITHKHNPILFN